jgi:hypothetical protein
MRNVPVYAATIALLLALTNLLVFAANHVASPIFGVVIPNGYRQWEAVAPSREGGAVNELRIIFGNAIAMRAYRAGTLPFPDGTTLVKVAWKEVPSHVAGDFAGQSFRLQPFFPGQPTTIQVMVKNSKKYSSTGGWGFGKWTNGKSWDAAQMRTCFPCHAAYVARHDFVFTRYAP